MEAPQHSAALIELGEHTTVSALLAAEEVAGRAEPAARTRRQKGLVRIGRHPVSLYLRRAFSAGLLLHGAAPRAVDARPSEYRCGTCRFAQRVAYAPAGGAVRGPARPYQPGVDGASQRGSWKCWRWPEKVTRGPATTIRMMWPACRNWLPRLDETDKTAVVSGHTDTPD